MFFIALLSNNREIMDNWQTISIERVKALAPFIDQYGLGDNFVFGEVSGQKVEQSTAILQLLKYPIRFDGYIVFFCKSGNFSVDVNLDRYEIHQHSLMVNLPGQIIKLDRYSQEDMRNSDLIFVLISKDFISNIRLDFYRIFKDSMRMLDNPCITLKEEQLGIAEDYFNLAKRILSSDMHNKKEAIGSLLTSLIYAAVDIWSKHISDASDRKGDNAARLKVLFERFISLVEEYHARERQVGFYADKLCLTPKYLSKLIKQVSGRSAPDWINEYVVLEAKNMLKYTDLTIGQIVYHLNFPSQSVFYKFFKSRTGVTPSEYRKS